jgi:hypothetical protein
MRKSIEESAIAQLSFLQEVQRRQFCLDSVGKSHIAFWGARFWFPFGPSSSSPVAGVHSE